MSSHRGRLHNGARPALVLLGLVLATGALSGCSGDGDRPELPAASNLPTISLPTDIAVPTVTRTPTRTPRPTSEPSESPSPTTSASPDPTPTSTEVETTAPKPTPTETETETATVTATATETATETTPTETTPTETPTSSQPPTTEQSTAPSNPEADEADQTDAVDPWVWLLVAGLILAVAAIAAIMIGRARRRGRWNTEFDAATHEVRRFARELLPQLIALGALPEVAGGWEVAAGRVAAVEDHLTELEATSPTEQVRPRARVLRDAVRTARHDLDQLTASAAPRDLTPELQTIATSLEQAITAAEAEAAL